MIRDKKEVMKDVGKTLDTRIIIQKRTVIKDDMKQERSTWADWETIWAEKKNLFGQEYYAAKSVNEENTLDFITRDAGPIKEMDTLNYRISYQGKKFEIKLIDYIPGGMWVKLKVLERGVNG